MFDQSAVPLDRWDFAARPARRLVAGTALPALGG